MAESFKYVLLGLFIAVTYGLSLWGMRKAKNLAGFSIGNRDMHPVMVGVTLASSIASTATFVINPGFVYTHGLSAFLHYGVAAYLGSAAALILLCKRFRSQGGASGALTIPHWIRSRYGSRAFATYFAIINLFSVTFVVLILVGCAILASALFGISQHLALVLVLVFVFSYVLLGGAYAHAYTNAFQSVLMILIALVVITSGFSLFSSGFMESLKSVGSDYAAPFNPNSNLYYNAFSVLVSAFVITFALMLQPHILTKALYLKDEKESTQFLATALIVGLIFSGMLLVGFYARLKGLEIPSQDRVVAIYINDLWRDSAGGQLMLAVVSIALLAAGMSTLDGILVALSAMVINDLYLPFRKGELEKHTGINGSRWVLVAIGLAGGALAWHPPPFVGIFAQQGVYALAAASFVPVGLGLVWKGPFPVWLASTASAIGIAGHFFLNQVAGMVNPAVSATWAILASTFIALVLLLVQNRIVVNSQARPELQGEAP